jgi:GNAT superfamily N-acetyltransferase
VIDLLIRPAAPSDVSAMAALVRAAYAGYVDRIGREPAPMAADYGAILTHGHGWVALRGHELVGVLVLEPEADHLRLENIAVSPEVQGQGVGTLLLGFADDEARRRHLPEVRLYTNAAMSENLAYYPRHGYRETHRASADGFDRVYFTKPVTAGG